MKHILKVLRFIIFYNFVSFSISKTIKFTTSSVNTNENHYIIVHGKQPISVI